MGDDLTAPFDKAQGDRERKGRKKDFAWVGTGLKPSL